LFKFLLLGKKPVDNAADNDIRDDSYGFGGKQESEVIFQPVGIIIMGVSQKGIDFPHDI